MGKLEARELKELHIYKVAKLKIEEVKRWLEGLVRFSGRPYVFTPGPLLILKYPSKNLQCHFFKLFYVFPQNRFLYSWCICTVIEGEIVFLNFVFWGLGSCLQ